MIDYSPYKQLVLDLQSVDSQISQLIEQIIAEAEHLDDHPEDSTDDLYDLINQLETALPGSSLTESQVSDVENFITFIKNEKPKRQTYGGDDPKLMS